MALRAEVMLPNVQRVAAFVELLRWRSVGLIIDPTTLHVEGWQQGDYHRFWRSVIARHVRRIIFLDGWELSVGCVLEFETAQDLDLDCVDERFQPLEREVALQLIRDGLREVEALGRPSPQIASTLDRLSAVHRPSIGATERGLYKDVVLDHLARTANVAQFVSFATGDLAQRFGRIRGFAPNAAFASIADAVSFLLASSGEGMVNIRSYLPDRPQGNPFIRNLDKVDQVLAHLGKLAAEGLYTIVNETVDEHDGGVSGVSYRGLLEFAPDATPRCVDDPSVVKAVMPFELGMTLLRSVYGVEPDLRGREGARVEFSVHPAPRGWMNGHSIIWQSEQKPLPEVLLQPSWPNAFSRMIGDKAYGLALAAAAGLLVPRTIVYTRRLYPFGFGASTGSGDLWTRTCPEVKVPGFYSSVSRWHDPYEVLADWRVLAPPDELATKGTPPAPLASIIVQEGVAPLFSGRARSRDATLRGSSGAGDRFMLGEGEDPIPEAVSEPVRELGREAEQWFGPVTYEWVFDGKLAWLVQVSPDHHPIGAARRVGVRWREFIVRGGPQSIEQFRRLALEVRGTDTGILVVGNVSPLSHYGEIADEHEVPVYFEPSSSTS